MFMTDHKHVRVFGIAQLLPVFTRFWVGIQVRQCPALNIDGFADINRVVFFVVALLALIVDNVDRWIIR